MEEPSAVNAAHIPSGDNKNKCCKILPEDSSGQDFVMRPGKNSRERGY
jgi:hypothetical protein